MYDLGSHFHIDVNKGKTPTSCVFRGNYYRGQRSRRFQANQDAGVGNTAWRRRKGRL